MDSTKRLRFFNPNLSFPLLTVISAGLRLAGGSKTDSKEDDNVMVTGLIAGIGFFVGFLILLCVTWYCCCGNGCEKKDTFKRRIAPSPPHSEPSTRSTTAESSRSRRQ